MAHDVIDLLDHFGWQKHVHLNGISMGGMIALELVSRWPERFSSVVLTSTTPGGQIPPVSRTLWIQTPLTLIFFFGLGQGHRDLFEIDLCPGSDLQVHPGPCPRLPSSVALCQTDGDRT